MLLVSPSFFVKVISDFNIQTGQEGQDIVNFFSPDQHEWKSLSLLFDQLCNNSFEAAHTSPEKHQPTKHRGAVDVILGWPASKTASAKTLIINNLMCTKVHT